MRRPSGIWPPSKPGRRKYALRDFCPLLPLPVVLPSFEPIPRPTRTLRCRDPRAGLRLERFTAMLSSIFVRIRDAYYALFYCARLLLYGYEMPYLVNHPTDCRRVLTLHHLIHAAK